MTATPVSATGPATNPRRALRGDPVRPTPRPRGATCAPFLRRGGATVITKDRRISAYAHVATLW